MNNICTKRQMVPLEELVTNGTCNEALFVWMDVQGTSLPASGGCRRELSKRPQRPQRM